MSQILETLENEVFNDMNEVTNTDNNIIKYKTNPLDRARMRHMGSVIRKLRGLK